MENDRPQNVGECRVGRSRARCRGGCEGRLAKRESEKGLEKVRELTGRRSGRESGSVNLGSGLGGKRGGEPKPTVANKRFRLGPLVHLWASAYMDLNSVLSARVEPLSLNKNSRFKKWGLFFPLEIFQAELIHILKIRVRFFFSNFARNKANIQELEFL